MERSPFLRDGTGTGQGGSARASGGGEGPTGSFLEGERSGLTRSTREGGRGKGRGEEEEPGPTGGSGPGPTRPVPFPLLPLTERRPPWRTTSASWAAPSWSRTGMWKQPTALSTGGGAPGGLGGVPFVPGMGGTPQLGREPVTGQGPRRGGEGPVN